MKTFFFLVIEAKKLVEVFKNVVNCHANRLKEINLLKNQLFIYKCPVNIKVHFLKLFYFKDNDIHFYTQTLVDIKYNIQS